MNLQQVSRLFVSVILFAACVVLVLLAQAQSGTVDPNKCYTEWDFCNAGDEHQNAYHWRLGWCVAAVERGAVSVSVSACMGQEEGTVSFPRSLSVPPVPAAGDDNKCYTEWDFCSSGSEAENAYFWKLGWCVAGVERGTILISLGQCMSGEAPPIGGILIPLLPEGTLEPGKNVCLRWIFSGAVGTDICVHWSLTPYVWDATLPPGMICWTRSYEWPFHCLEHGPNQATQTARAGG